MKSGPFPARREDAWPDLFPADAVFEQATARDAGRFALLDDERALLGPNAAPNRALELTLGRGCARAALARCDPALADRPIVRLAGRQPRWPEGYVGAITHHHGEAAAVVARAEAYAGVGVDLEAVHRPRPSLVRRILRAAEAELLERLDAAGRAERFVLVFSAKESLFKALYPATGVYLGFQDATVEVGRALPGRVGTLRWRVHKPCGPRFPRGCTGLGAYVRREGRVLTGVWVPAQEDE